MAEAEEDKLEQSCNTQPEASTSGRSDKEGVFVIYTDGEIALDGFYKNGRRNDVFGMQGRVLASSAYRGKLAVATTSKLGSCTVAMYSLQVALAISWKSELGHSFLTALLMLLTLNCHLKDSHTIWWKPSLGLIQLMWDGRQAPLLQDMGKML